MIWQSNGDFYYTAIGNIYRVALGSGAQALLTATNPIAYGLCEGPDGFIYCSADEVTPSGHASVRRVDPVTGSWTDVAYGGIAKPRGVGFDQRDSLYVESWGNRAVYRVDPVTQTVGQLSPITTEYTANWMVAHPDGYLYFTHMVGGATPGPRIDRQETVAGVRTALPGSPVLGQVVVAINHVPFGVSTSATKSSWGRLKSLYR
jgi:streptogramin lyase